ncbi:MAG TPA: serine/threonine-protein kinase, partial [Kofleriaceae bacterium]|nr:serine/threonine-protein kinase [Kofleriaceae bacterium]
MRTLGRYELLRPLARGGMAEVYLARRRVAGVEKRLVIKRLRRERISDPRFLDLFVKEAQLSMTLVQQNIVPVFDFGRIGDDVFLAMEHIDGKDLGSTLARARGVGMPPLVAAFVVSECCHALHHAHSGVAGRQVVHRDVTPRNVLLSWAGEVKLADFGIASAMGAVDGSLVGTPGYMAPEQARGEPLDARADLYSLGLVLWEMLTGGHVRRGADAATLLEAAKRNALPPVPDGLPEALAALLRQATALSPAARIDSARTMADALDTFMVGERARHGGAAPAQQLAAWLAERWADAGEDPLELPEVEGGRMLTFLDDGAEGVLGTGTLRSMAVTSGPEGEPPDAPQGGPSAQGSEPPQAAPVGARGKAAAAESKEPASLL